MVVGNARLLKQVYIFGIVLTIAVYYGTIYYFSYNMPYNDDYDVILAFMNKYVETKDMMSRLQLIFAQHFEHRPGFTHIITLIQYKITGHVSFVFITAIGNMAVLVIYLIFLNMIRNHHEAQNSMTDHGLLAMITSFLLFNFSFFIIITWATGSTALLWCFAFSLMMCNFITKANGFYIALIAGLGAVICEGNGLFVLIVGLWYLISSKQWRRATIFFIYTVSTYYLYFRDYSWFNWSDWHTGNIFTLQFLQRLFSIGVHFLAFIGSLFSVSHPQLNLPSALIAIPMICGAIMIFTFIYLTIIGERVFRPDALHLFAVFLITTGMAIAFSRVHLGIAQATAVRYKIVSTLFLICITYLIYDYFVSGKYGKKVSIILCLGSIILWTSSLIYIYPLNMHMQALRLPITNEYTNPYIQFHRGRSAAMSILREAEEKKIFEPPLHYKK